MLGEGKDVADVWQELQVAVQTYYRWRKQFVDGRRREAAHIRRQVRLSPDHHSSSRTPIRNHP
jgi:transposase-like protein